MFGAMGAEFKNIVQTVIHIFTGGDYMAKQKELTYEAVFVKKDGTEIPWDSMSKEEKARQSIACQEKMMRVFGYKRVGKG